MQYLRSFKCPTNHHVLKGFFQKFIPTHICLEGAKSRIGKKREDLPWLETELEEDFKQWICNYPEKSLPKIMDLLEKYKTDRQIMIFKSRDEANI